MAPFDVTHACCAGEVEWNVSNVVAHLAGAGSSSDQRVLAETGTGTGLLTFRMCCKTILTDRARNIDSKNGREHANRFNPPLSLIRLLPTRFSTSSFATRSPRLRTYYDTAVKQRHGP